MPTKVSMPLQASHATGIAFAYVLESGEKDARMDSTPEPVRYARHQVRGCLHGMKLCVAALETDLPPEETQEFLDHIEQAAAKMPQLLDDLDAVAPPQPA